MKRKVSPSKTNDVLRDIFLYSAAPVFFTLFAISSTQAFGDIAYVANENTTGIVNL